jgi:ankyrin repeat protein
MAAAVNNNLMQKYKAEANASFHNTPLHRAALEGNLEEVKKLVEGGADVNAKNTIGKTPLHMASGNGHQDVVYYLLGIKGINTGATNAFGWNAIKLTKAQLSSNVTAGGYRRKMKTRSKTRSNRRSTRRVQRR